MRHKTFGAALLIGGTLFALAGCDDSDKPAKVYASMDECVAELSQNECQKGFENAQKDHETAAPHYEAQGSCEELYGQGNCVPRRNEAGESFFMPMMMGFMMGQSFDSDHRRIYVSTPVYVNRSGAVYSGGSQIGTRSPVSPGSSARSFTVSRSGFGASASTVHSSSAAVAPASAGSISRGGFGSTAAGHATSAGE